MAARSPDTVDASILSRGAHSRRALAYAAFGLRNTSS